MYRKQHASPPRKGMILIVVLCMLTLFAIVGITFVLYAESIAAASRLNKDSQTVTPPTVDPASRIALNTFLNAFLNGTLDPENALRGTDLMTDMYGGYGGATTVSGQVAPLTPFGGTGRLHFTYTSGPFIGLDDFDLVNYQYHQADAFRHDPECYDVTGSIYSATSATTGTPKPYVGGYNPPYTYPDKNHIFLGAIRPSDGAVIARSFHRDYGPFGSLDPTNPNWGPTYTAPVTAANAKYLLLRPHPSYHPNFGSKTSGAQDGKPLDIGGDVQNLPQSAGFVDASGVLHPNANDSFWIDIGAPVQTAPDGTKFKLLIAPFVTDLDGLLNVNATGNVRLNLGGATPPQLSSASNLGYGTWEVNPAKVLDWVDGMGKPEYPQLFTQQTSSPFNYGRYGQDLRPGNGAMTSTASLTRAPHYYAPTDYDAVVGYASTAGFGSQSNTLPPSSFFSTGTLLFPTFPPGYESGVSATNPLTNLEAVDHPMLYNPVAPLAQTATGLYDRRFLTGDMERLLRWNDIGYQSLTSGLGTQLSNNLVTDTNTANAARRRRQVTTDSTDVMVAGGAPYGTTPVLGSYGTTSALTAPQGAAISFPTLTAPNLPGGTPGFPGWEFANGGATGRNWQFNFGPYLNGTNTIIAALRRLHLNRTLTQYPTHDLTQRHDDNSVNTSSSLQYGQAVQDRQKFADDIYRTLLVVTGTPAPAIPSAPTDVELLTMRWLAQLAVNIVDFIDEDNVCTVFNFYGTNDGLPAANLGDMYTSGMPATANPDCPKYWVVGTEMPRLLLTEALAEASTSTATGAANTPTANVKVWAELFNPLSGTNSSQPATNANYQDGNSAVPLQVAMIATSQNTNLMNANNAYAPYQIVVTNPSTGNSSGLAQTIANPFGAADIAPNAPFVSTTVTDFTTTAANPLNFVGGAAQPPGTVPWVGAFNSTSTLTPPNPPTVPYFIVGPATDDGMASGTGAQNWMADPLVAGSTVPANTPYLRIGTTNSAANSGLSYFPTTWTAASTTDQRTTGVTILLRRLANPHAPPDPNPTIPGPLPNPWYNPYVTIDYLDQIPIRDATQDVGTLYASRGKKQPFASKTVLTTPPRTVDPVNSQVQDQTTADPMAKPTGTSTITQIYHTFGQTNAPLTTPFTWLVHLDRQPVSPMELLHVSAFPPHLLTQRFITGSLPTQQFNHLVPWFDQDLTATPGQSHRLYRLFEFLDSSVQPPWTAIGNRFPGKVNINTIWGPLGSPNEIFRGICDSNPNNFFNVDATGTYVGTGPSDAAVDAVWTNLLTSRTPNNGIPGDPNAVATPDRPFLSLATGQDLGGPGTQYPNGRGINDTLFRTLTTGSTSLINGPQLLLEDPTILPTSTAHPYQRYQMLTKVFNNVTNRSNCFAIWVTAGYFRVLDDTQVPPVLGEEINISTGKNVRHRSFCIVDRTKKELFSTTTSAAITVSQPSSYSPYSMSVSDLSTVLSATSGSNPLTGATWTLSAGQVLIIEPGTPTEEAVTVAGTSPGPYSTVFLKTHPLNSTVLIRGNSGPIPSTATYDYRQDPAVLYTNLIN